MPALSRSFSHQTSTFTCASNVFSIFDINGNIKAIPFTITEISNLFYEDVKSVLTEAGMIEGYDDSKNMIKILGQEYTFVVINNWDSTKCASAGSGITPTNGTTESVSTPIPAVFRNGQTWVQADGFVANINAAINTYSTSTYAVANNVGGYGICNSYSYRVSTSYNSGDAYHHPMTTIYGNRVIRECIRRTGRTVCSNANYCGANESDFSNAAFPLQSKKHSLRYDANDYRYCINCYYNTNFVLLTYSLTVADYTCPLCFMATGMDKDSRNIHYFSGDPSSYVPLSCGSTGVSNTISAGNANEMTFSTYVPSLSTNGTGQSNGGTLINNIKLKAYNLHSIISLDDAEMKEIDGHKVYYAISEHQTSPALLFNTYDNFTGVDLVKRYVPKTVNQQYRMPLNLKHNYGHFDNIYYTTDMSLGYNNFYEIDGDTYYLVGHDYRTDYNYYYYNVLLKI